MPTDTWCTMQYVNTHDLARLAKVASRCGFDIDKQLQEIGIAASERAHSETLWDAHSLRLLYDSGTRLSASAHYPFIVGELFLFDRAPEVEVFLATCVTLRDALTLIPQLPYLIQPDTVGWQDMDDHHLHLMVELLHNGNRLDNPGYIETVFVAAVRLLREVANSPINVGLSFRHQPLLPLKDYAKQFGVEPVFGVECNRISLPLNELDRSRRSPSPMLHAQSLLLLESRLRRLQARNSLGRIIETMILYSPTLSMSEVCARLGTEPRSLQRRLHEAGNSFNSIRAAAHFQLARLMLATPALDIDTIATKLGFADRNGFSKAFTKWAGKAPGQFRKSIG